MKIPRIFSYSFLFSLLMIVYHGSGGIFFPVLPLFLSKNLAVDQVGILMAIIPLSTITFQLVWGWLADKWGVAKVLMRLSEKSFQINKIHNIVPLSA